jgi:hypothetical protein
MMNTKTKTASVITLGILLAICLITSTVVTHDVSAKKPDKKKSNVKIHIKVKGIPEGTKILSVALTIADNQPQIHVQTIDSNETSVGINFNKVEAAQGDPFTVSVNDKTVDGKITEKNKPNNVIVNLS